MSRPLYREPHQFGRSEAPAFENELADVLEIAFAAGIHHLEGVVEALNRSRLRPPQGGQWTSENFRSLMAELGR